MTIFQAIILGILQAFTEFLPVSSSGHLVLVQKFFLLEPPIFFDILVHVGTLLAVIFYLRKDLVFLLKNLKNKENQRLIFLVLLGTLPVVIIGFFLKNKIEEIFDSFLWVGFSFLITSIILFATYFAKKREKSLEKISFFDSFFIGVFQALAILPGVSRSGSTISAGLFRQIKRNDAFRFSLFLAIPAILGALSLHLFEIRNISNSEIVSGVTGFLVAMIFGFFALKILEKVLAKGKLHLFAIYTATLGVFVLVLLARK